MKKFILFSAIIIFLSLATSMADVHAQTDERSAPPPELSREQALVTLSQLYDGIEASTGPVIEANSFTTIPGTGSGILEEIRYHIFKPRPTGAEIFIMVCLLLLLPQGFFTIFWMVYAWNDPNKAEESASPKVYLPPQLSFTALLPARHEEMVIKDTIYAVNAINYPAHLKEILVLIRDENDDGTIAKVNEAIAELGNPNIRLITFTEGPRNKPNGLNRGLKHAKNDVVCIFDAEDEPHPEIYDIINTVMVRDGADVVQSGVQLMNYDSNWFSALNCLEYFFWFKSGMHLFTRLLNVTPLGGNTVFFKRNWLELVDGWDDGLLT